MMNKSLYILLIAFLGLTVSSGILSSIIRLEIGTAVYSLNAYPAWFLVMNGTTIIGSILLLKYYYHHNYRFAFITGIIAGVANLGYAIVVYNMLTLGGRGFYIPISLIYLCAIIGYSASLVFSSTGKRTWVKLAGICGLLLGIVLLSAYIGSINPKNVYMNNILGKIVPWSPMIGALINGLFIVNFVGEALKAENTTTHRQESLKNLFGFAAIVAFAFTIALGATLFSQSFGLFWGRNHDSELAQRMVKLAGGPKTFVDSKGDSLRYILIKPQGYDKQKKYPLVVSLPYGRYEAGAAQVLSDAYRSAYPAFIFVPYIPEHQSWDGVPGLPSLDTLIYQTISALPEPGIDVKRRYVTGVSFGGYGTWHFICSRPDMFAAAIPVSGAGDPKLASKIVNMPIWAFHGAKDRNVPVSGSRDMIAAIKKAGGHPKYTEYPDEAHGIWNKVSETPGLWDWLFAQEQK